MCGIAGIYDRTERVPFPVIKSLTDELRHRGPDDEGFLSYSPDSRTLDASRARARQDANLYLGHRRLSILDLSARGHQPMSRAGELLWIIHNGEIYNYRELRKELQGRGHAFQSQTDTEVLLAAYEEWGPECLERLDGMWAFVILDLRKNILFGSRDRFGVKPFYYYRDPERFAFASEIKALLRLPFLKREINDQAAFDFLVFGLTGASEASLFKGILELFPSHAFSLDLASNSLRTWKYYELAINERWDGYDVSKAADYTRRTRQLLIESVSSHLQSDVKVGTCLSGGLDSSTIVCITNQLLEKEHPTQIGDRQCVFTACYPESSGVDEQFWAARVAQATRTSWFRSFIRPQEIERNIEDIVYTQDIPFASTSGVIPQYFLMRSVRDAGVKVLLDGQGGDELFAGYRGAYLSFFSEIARSLSLGALRREISSIGNSPITPQFLTSSLAKLYLPRLVPRSILEVLLKRQKRGFPYLDQDFLRKNHEQISVYQHRRIDKLNLSLSLVLSRSDFRYLLRYEDRNSMRYSIEARSPFADSRRLIEYVFGVPGHYKIHHGWSKSLLRQAMLGILPEEIRWRKDKLGFPTPENYWLKSLREPIGSAFDGQADGYLDIQKIGANLDSIINHPLHVNYNPFLWRAFIFRIWRRVFQV